MSRKGRKEEVKDLVIDFSEVQISTLNSNGRLTDLLGTCLEFDLSTIEEHDFKNRKAVTVVVRYGDKVERRHTFSEVLIKQLLMSKELYPNAKLTAKVIKYKNYFRLMGCK
jgi:hypothetical protein